jgi:3-deoxy-D-manno-octulosonic-acid transferase
VPDLTAGVAQAMQLARDPVQQAAASERASRFARQHRGAARATVRELLQLVRLRTVGRFEDDGDA